MTERGWIAGSAHVAAGARNFKLWSPAALEQGRAFPLVVMLHGCTHDAMEMARISGMNELADARRFLVLYPEQSRRANLLRCWKWFHPRHQARDAGEPSILAAVVRQVCSAHPVDPERIYLAGVSAGGAMVSILAATYPELFAAAAICAGAEFKAAASMSEAFTVMKRGGPDPEQQGQLAFDAMRAGLACKQRRRMPVIVFQGTADPYVHMVNAGQVIAQWTATNARLAASLGERSLAVTEEVTAGQVPGGHAYQRHIFVEKDGRLLLEEWVVKGLGHAWSGSPQRSRYGDPRGPNASAEIWRFFSEACSLHPKPIEGSE
jgi:poly(hydroxyalkanoate) depolymerase family esterase